MGARNPRPHACDARAGPPPAGHALPVFYNVRIGAPALQAWIAARALP